MVRAWMSTFVWAGAQNRIMDAWVCSGFDDILRVVGLIQMECHLEHDRPGNPSTELPMIPTSSLFHHTLWRGFANSQTHSEGEVAVLDRTPMQHLEIFSCYLFAFLRLGWCS
jgi:hypothetical protein